MIKATDKVKATLKNEGTDVIISIWGDIDEEAIFESNSSEFKGRIIIDMEDVRLINSCGIRNWVMWIQKLDTNAQIILRHCPKIIVDQINILNGFLPKSARVESFYVPYYCDECNSEDLLLAVRGKDFFEKTADQPTKNLIPDERDCPKCGATMELDVIKDKYFGFLTSGH